LAKKKQNPWTPSGRPQRAGRRADFIRKTTSSAGKNGPFWIYGFHAVRAALSNPTRASIKIVATTRALSEIGAKPPENLPVEPADPEAISKLLPSGAVHQGIALLCEPLANPDLETILAKHPPGRRMVAVLDQISDPHNEGAILRSAAAFGVCAIIVQNRHAPAESGALAKSASGALDIVPRISVVNITRTLEELERMGFWRIALAGDAQSSLKEVGREGDITIVLGAEGTGIRRLVRETCDVSAAIPLSGDMASLNVSNAAAIAFYELHNLKKE
jgi:23S rRNA (guanosine2251-2'-O)-methyltransferase